MSKNGTYRNTTAVLCVRNAWSNDLGIFETTSRDSRAFEKRRLLKIGVEVAFADGFVGNDYCLILIELQADSIPHFRSSIQQVIYRSFLLSEYVMAESLKGFVSLHQSSTVQNVLGYI